MSEAEKKNFTACEYKEMTVRSDRASLYLDSYESFGWKQDENFPPKESGGKITLRFRRDRKLVNRTELTRLQRHFEADIEEIDALERSKTGTASAWALAVGLLGTVFMAGAVFAVTASPPRILLSVVLSVPAFGGWIAPWFVYRWVKVRKTRQVEPFIEEKMEEIYSICEKGQSLL